MTIILLQRFDPRMQGVGGFERAVELDDGERLEFDIPSNVRPPWALEGRHGATATPVPRDVPAGPTISHQRSTRARTLALARVEAANALSGLFFKLSWRLESNAHSEADIIALAKARAEEYLPHPEYVTDHIPVIKSAKEYDQYSTRHIRKYLTLNTQHARVPLTLIMPKLRELGTLDAGSYQTYMWQLIRCSSFIHPFYEPNTY